MIFLAQTKDYKYYCDKKDEEQLYLVRNKDGYTFNNTSMIENALAEDIEKGNITKIAPRFIYNYNEILKELIK